jgi:hypothetical protein
MMRSVEFFRTAQRTIATAEGRLISIAPHHADSGASIRLAGSAE